MTPLEFLALMLGVTALGGLAHAIARSRRRRSLRKLAEQWHMRYTPRDLFRLSQRIAGQFPIPDAADLRILDLIYGTQGQRHRYVFTAEYTTGPVSRQQREERAMTFCEDKDAGHGGTCSPIVAGEEGLTLVEQYRRLGQQWQQT